MAKAKLEQKFNKFEYAQSDEELTEKVIELSKQNPQLVFVWMVSFTKVYIEGYATRSAIPFDSYESHLRYTEYFLQNGKKVLPTQGQLNLVEQYGWGRD